MKKFTFNFAFLDRFRKSKPSADENSEIHNSHEELSEYDSDETPEEFAEKTLSGFKIPEMNEEIHDEIKDDEIEDEATNSNSQFDEMTIPNKPSETSRFKFKFPKFDSQSATRKIKKSLSEKSPMNSLEIISWNNFVLGLFSPYTRGKIHAVFIIFLVVVVTYMLGKNTALFFSKSPSVLRSARPTILVPMEKVDTTLQDINKITSTNLFNVKESEKSLTGSSKLDIDSIICLEAEKQTSLEIKLLDTIVLQDSVKSVASVQVRGSSELTNVREGERLDEMAEVSKIGRMKVILKNLQTGDCEYAKTDLEEEAPMPNLQIVSAKAGKSLFKSTNPNIKNTGNNFKIKRSFRDSMINNMSNVLTQAKAVQITNPDGSLCFKMTEVIAGSLYSQLDIQENDIICNINGKKIDNLNELMGLLGRIKEIDQFQIGLKRNGMSENKEYGFE